MQKESDREAALTKRAGGTAVAGPRQRGKTNLTEKMDKMHMWEFALNLHYGKLSLLVKSKTKLSVTTGLLKQKPLVFVLPMQRRSFHAKKLLVLTQGRLVLLRPIRGHKGRTRFLHTTLWNTLPGASVQPSNAVFPADQRPQAPRPDFSNGFFGELLLFLRRYLFALLYRMMQQNAWQLWRRDLFLGMNRGISFPASFPLRSYPLFHLCFWPLASTQQLMQFMDGFS